ncbi:MAG: SIMPL domain-containing protein [Bacteroidales bacterium]
MKELNLKISVVIIAAAIVVMGFFIYKGLHSFVDKEKIVTVRGLSERIVDVDNANVSIEYVVAGNEMSQVLATIEQNNNKIKDFVRSKGISSNEITINVPHINDRQTNEYRSKDITYRYYATVEIVLISDKVKNIRDVEMSQFDLIKQGITLKDNSYYYNDDENYGRYRFTKLNDIKPDMIKESIKNAKKAAEEFTISSSAKIKGIKSAYQGQFTITPTDDPLKVKIRVVSTIEYFID